MQHVTKYLRPNHGRKHRRDRGTVPPNGGVWGTAHAFVPPQCLSARTKKVINFLAEKIKKIRDFSARWLKQKGRQMFIPRKDGKFIWPSKNLASFLRPLARLPPPPFSPRPGFRLCAKLRGRRWTMICTVIWDMPVGLPYRPIGNQKQLKDEYGSRPGLRVKAPLRQFLP
jgi:hypothetical protein